MVKNIHWAEACENQFIIADCLKQSALSVQQKERIHQQLLSTDCDDALILINGEMNQNELIFDMLVLGIDGLWGEFCGNGSRACAAYLLEQYPGYTRFILRGSNQNYVLKNEGKHIFSIELPRVSFAHNPKFVLESTNIEHITEPFSYQLDGNTLVYAELLEPHFILNKSLAQHEIVSLGRALNSKKELFPNGINLTVFSCTEEEGVLQAVTFERGAQRLTGSCGTGACCAGAFFLKNKPGKLQIRNPGGTLEVTLHESGVRLLGSASVNPGKRVTKSKGAC